MKSVYLAGPIQHAEDHGTNWREEIQADFPDRFEWLDPLSKYDPTDPKVDFYYDEGERDDLYELKTQETEDGDAKYVTPGDIVEGDKHIIDEADAILVGWSEVPSCGTPMEVMYQYMVNELHPHRGHVPIVVWWRDESDADSHLSPWMEYHADRIELDREDALNVLDFQLESEIELQ